MAASHMPMTRATLPMKTPLLACLASVLVAALPVRAASPKAPAQRSPAFVADLSLQPIRHGARCPLPDKGSCVIRKPVGMRYRVLSTGVDLQDMGDYWIADFSRTDGKPTDRKLLRVLGDHGDLHEIEVRFPPPAAVKAKPAAAKEAVKEPVKEPVPEPAKNEEQAP